MPWLLAALVVMTTMTSHDTGALSTARTRFQPGVTLLHLAVDNSTGIVYVGAVNHVYQLTADRLEPLAVAVTGNVLLLCRCQIWNCPRACCFHPFGFLQPQAETICGRMMPLNMLFLN